MKNILCIDYFKVYYSDASQFYDIIFMASVQSRLSYPPR